PPRQPVQPPPRGVEGVEEHPVRRRRGRDRLGRAPVQRALPVQPREAAEDRLGPPPPGGLGRVPVVGFSRRRLRSVRRVPPGPRPFPSLDAALRRSLLSDASDASVPARPRDPSRSESESDGGPSTACGGASECDTTSNEPSDGAGDPAGGLGGRTYGAVPLADVADSSPPRSWDAGSPPDCSSTRTRSRGLEQEYGEGAPDRPPCGGGFEERNRDQEWQEAGRKVSGKGKTTKDDFRDRILTDGMNHGGGCGEVIDPTSSSSLCDLLYFNPMDGHQNGGPGLGPGRDPPGNYHPLTCPAVVSVDGDPEPTTRPRPVDL
ncbi:hypothetical protein THAOC_11029, partial [Thalassiosira oceanica]